MQIFEEVADLCKAHGAKRVWLDWAANDQDDRYKQYIDIADQLRVYACSKKTLIIIREAGSEQMINEIMTGTATLEHIDKWFRSVRWFNSPWTTQELKCSKNAFIVNNDILIPWEEFTKRLVGAGADSEWICNTFGEGSDLSQKFRWHRKGASLRSIMNLRGNNQDVDFAQYGHCMGRIGWEIASQKGLDNMSKMYAYSGLSGDVTALIGQSIESLVMMNVYGKQRVLN